MGSFLLILELFIKVKVLNWNIFMGFQKKIFFLGYD